MTSILAEGLEKTYVIKRKQPGFWGAVRSLVRPETEEKTAVRGICFEVRRGEAVAFLGPNGAGKSTTIKMLTGILHPSAGRLEVLGLIPWKERSRLAFRIGTVFGQKSQLWYHLPPQDTFELMASIYEIPKEAFKKRRDRLVELFELGPYLHTPVRKLSLGERMRCEMAAVLLHQPDILFLDEPTIGMDVVVKQKIRRMIRDLNREEGVTVFLTSHDAGDVEELCSRAMIINHGELVLDTSVSRLKREILQYKIVNLKLGAEPENLSFSGVEVIKRKGSGIKLKVDTRRTTVEAVIGQLIGRFPILDITVEDPPMEEVISAIYEMERGKEHVG
jgi:ABC-2 type transport system ATP-binding protein